MTNQEVLTKAVDKAFLNGWSIAKGAVLFSHHSTRERIVFTVYSSKFTKYTKSLAIEQVIFNHDFAKALWGDGYECDEDGTPMPYGFDSSVLDHRWQYHLQQMVIATDPIKYLGEHLE